MNVNKTLSAEAKKRQRRTDIRGYLFISPVMLGILLFTLIPMITSLYYSFFDYSVIAPPKNFGFQNYIDPFNSYNWDHMKKAICNTLFYTVINVPLNMVLSFALAMLLNNKIKGIGVFRLLCYVPCIIPSVIAGLMWKDIGNVDYGIANIILTSIGLEPFEWFSSDKTSMISFIITGLFSLGGGMILWLAQLKNIPGSMYEAAHIDGAGFWTKTFRITVPMCTPMIFYVLITSVIGTLQTGNGVLLLTGGTAGVNDSLLFYVLKVYFTAFNTFAMGAACALSWMLFVFIGLLTMLVFKTSSWVFYGEE